jgi:hypothetical protein
MYYFRNVVHAKKALSDPSSVWIPIGIILPLSLAMTFERAWSGYYYEATGAGAVSGRFMQDFYRSYKKYKAAAPEPPALPPAELSQP